MELNNFFWKFEFYTVLSVFLASSFGIRAARWLGEEEEEEEEEEALHQCND